MVAQGTARVRLAARAVRARGGIGSVEGPQVPNENHDPTFMIGRIRKPARCGRMGVPGPCGIGRLLHQEIFMKWETPQATDFRFGMEITMYIAKR